MDNKKELVCFPLRHNQKVPDVKSWRYLNKAEPKKFNNQNMGLITGEINGLTVFDIDSYKWTDKESHIFIKKFTKDFIKRFNTKTIKTAGGGYHLYFKYDQNILTTTNKDLEIDIRNDGAYVVCPPSSINGQKYEVINDVEIKECPKDLYKFYEKYIIKSSKKSNVKGASKKISKINNQDVNNCMMKFILDGKDWTVILNRLDKKYLSNYADWYKATLASKYLGFKKEWQEWSKAGNKYDYHKNNKVWNSIHYFDKLKTFNLVNSIIQNGDKSLKAFVKDKYISKCFYRPHEEELSGYIEINKPKLDDIEKPERFFKYEHNYVVKSDTGTGKTTAFKKYIKQVQTPFLSIVSRVCLGTEQYNNFLDEDIKCEFYQNKDFDFGQSLIITPESIPQIVNYDFSKYIVFLDEFNSIIEHILSSTTMNNNRVLVLFIILKMIRTCKQFIAVDADISQIAMKFLKCAGVEFKLYKNTFKHFKDVKVYFEKNQQSFYNKLKSENKFMLACDSKKNADTFYKMLCKDGIKDIKLITSDLLPDEDVDLDKYDKIIFSPKVIYGLDSTMERPVYGLYKGNTILPPQMVQQLARCRNPEYMNIYFENVKSSYPQYENFKDVLTTLNMEINAQTDLYTKLEKYEKKVMQDNEVDIDIFDGEDDEEIAHKAMIEASYKVYLPLKKLYNYKCDTYNTNKYIHLQLILKNRGMDVQVDKELPQRMNTQQVKEATMEILQEKIDTFDVENEHIKRRIEILGLPEDAITEDMKMLLIDNYKLLNYFNYANFKRKDKYKLIGELKDRQDFKDEKAKSTKNKIIVLQEMLQTLKLNKFDIEYSRKNEKSSIYIEMGKKYVEVSGARLQKPIQTDSDLHGAVVKLYKQLFGNIKTSWSMGNKKDKKNRKLSIKFTKDKDLFDEVYKYQYPQMKDLYKESNERLDQNI